MLKYIAKRSATVCPLPNMSRVMSLLLNQRGLTTPEAVAAFLHPCAENLHDPFLMQNMTGIVERIRRAIDADERITVYGDYDVDGVTASSILLLHLRAIGANASGYIPSRHDEGYGLNLNAMQRICADSDLIISVDCGITSVNEVDYVRGMGREIIVTDHHQLPPVLPECMCLNPLIGEYPFPKLCGAGVAMKLVQALSGIDALAQYYDLAALGTIADMVPLIDENRVLAQLGLTSMNANPRAGIAALARVSGLTGKPFTAGNLAFQIAPRINAGGRLEDANQCVELLTSTDDMRVQQLAERLDAENTHRKQLETEMLAQAEQSLANVDFTQIRAIIVSGRDWNPGVIGLVASRLTEKYHYPSIVFSSDGTRCVGSCRSIQGVDIFEALSSCRELYERFGGHPQAAGLTLPMDKLPEFTRRLNAYLAEHIAPETYFPAQEYDMDVELGELTIELANELAGLAPNGFGNPSPVLRTSAKVLNAQAVGAQGAHMKLVLGEGAAKLGGIAFRMGALASGLAGTQQDILLNLSINDYMGRQMAQAEVRAIKPVTPLQSLQISNEARTALEQRWLLSVLNGIAAERAAVRGISLTQLAERLNSSAQGILMHVSNAGAAKRALAQLASVCDINRIDVCYGYPQDKRCFNSLCVCAEGLPPKGYTRYVAMDGVIEGSQAARLSSAGALPFVPTGALCSANAVMPGCPSDDILRGIYAFVRANALRLSGAANVFELANALAEGLGLPRQSALIGLCILRQLELLRFEDAAPGCEMMPFKKVALSESMIYQRLHGTH